MRLLAYLTQGVGLLCYGLGLVVSVGLLLASKKAYRLPELDHPGLAALVLIVIFITAVGLIFLGHHLFLWGKRLSAKHAPSKGSSHLSIPENVVLYFRTFDDEAVTAESPTTLTLAGSIEVRSLTTEEEHLTKALDGLGRFMAIANPRDTLPQLGAKRLAAGGPEWKREVAELMLRAKLIVFRIGAGESLWWEIEQALHTVKPEKLVFLIPEDPTMYQRLRQRLEPLLGRRIPDLRYALSQGASLDALLYFDRNGAPHLNPLPDAGFRKSLAQPLRPILRIALKPVFANLGVRWTPPPIPVLNYLRVVFWLWWFGVCLYWLLVEGLLFTLGLDTFSLIISPVIALILFGTLKSGLGLWSGSVQLVGSLFQFRSKWWERSLDSPEPSVVEFLEHTYSVWASGELKSLGGHYAKDARQSQRRFVGAYLPNPGGVLSILATHFPPMVGEYLIGLGEEDEGVWPSLKHRGWFILTNRRLIQRDGRNNLYSEVSLQDIKEFRTRRAWTLTLILETKTNGTLCFEKVQLHPKDELLRETIRRSYTH